MLQLMHNINYGQCSKTFGRHCRLITVAEKGFCALRPLVRKDLVSYFEYVYPCIFMYSRMFCKRTCSLPLQSVFSVYHPLTVFVDSASNSQFENW